jgi:hypothetical protein
MDQGNHQVAQGGQDLWGAARAQAGAIFPKVDIAHIVQAVFNTPMPSHQVQQTLLSGLGRREGSDEIDHLSRGLADLGGGTRELGQLPRHTAGCGSFFCMAGLAPAI